MLVYFSAMWSQYSTGYFRLGRINPVDEGLPGYALASLANIFLPDNFWNQKSMFSNYNYNLLYVLAILLVLIIYYMIKDIFKNAIRSSKDILRALMLPISFGTMLFLLKLLKPEVFLKASLPLSYVLMFTWSRNMIEIQVYFVTKQEFKPFNLGTLTFLISSSLFLFLNIDPITYFWVIAAISTSVFF
jgi:hypothetical protein